MTTYRFLTVKSKDRNNKNKKEEIKIKDGDKKEDKTQDVKKESQSGKNETTIQNFFQIYCFENNKFSFRYFLIPAKKRKETDVKFIMETTKETKVQLKLDGKIINVERNKQSPRNYESEHLQQKLYESKEKKLTVTMENSTGNSVVDFYFAKARDGNDKSQALREIIENATNFTLNSSKSFLEDTQMGSLTLQHLVNDCVMNKSNYLSESESFAICTRISYKPPSNPHEKSDWIHFLQALYHFAVEFHTFSWLFKQNCAVFPSKTNGVVEMFFNLTPSVDERVGAIWPNCNETFGFLAVTYFEGKIDKNSVVRLDFNATPLFICELMEKNNVQKMIVRNQLSKKLELLSRDEYKNRLLLDFRCDKKLIKSYVGLMEQLSLEQTNGKIIAEFNGQDLFNNNTSTISFGELSIIMKDLSNQHIALADTFQIKIPPFDGPTDSLEDIIMLAKHMYSVMTTLLTNREEQKTSVPYFSDNSMESTSPISETPQLDAEEFLGFKPSLIPYFDMIFQESTWEFNEDPSLSLSIPFEESKKRRKGD